MITRPTRRALDAAEQAAEVRRWERAVAAKLREVKGVTDALRLAGLYADLSHQYTALGHARDGVAYDRQAQRENARAAPCLGCGRALGVCACIRPYRP